MACRETTPGIRAASRGIQLPAMCSLSSTTCRLLSRPRGQGHLPLRLASSRSLDSSSSLGPPVASSGGLPCRWPSLRPPLCGGTCGTSLEDGPSCLGSASASGRYSVLTVCLPAGAVLCQGRQFTRSCSQGLMKDPVFAPALVFAGWRVWTQVATVSSSLGGIHPDPPPLPW